MLISQIVIRINRNRVHLAYQKAQREQHNFGVLTIAFSSNGLSEEMKKKLCSIICHGR